jgi:hypothetical protein
MTCSASFNPYGGMRYSELCGLRKDYAKMQHAAVAARKVAERNLVLIAEALRGAPEPIRYEVSDHAVVRYLERVEGIDIAAIRDTITLNCEGGRPLIGEKLRGGDGFLYCINSDGFVTTVLPLDAVVDELAEAERAMRERPRPNGSARRRIRRKGAAREYLASGMEAATAGETGTGSTEGDSPTAEGGDAQ